MLTDRVFLATHIDDFRTEVLNDLSVDDLFLMFDEKLELGYIIAARFSQFREAVEADQALDRELDRDRATDMRARGE